MDLHKVGFQFPIESVCKRKGNWQICQSSFCTSAVNEETSLLATEAQVGFDAADRKHGQACQNTAYTTVASNDNLFPSIAILLGGPRKSFFSVT